MTAQCLDGQRNAILQKTYQLRFSQLEHYREQVWSVLCREYFSAWIAPESVVLDLGSGWGEFINHIPASKKYALDLNAEAEIRLSKEICFLHQDGSQPWQLSPETLDVVFTSNFFEHLSDKAHVEKALTEAHRCLKPDGLLICLGPNIRCLPGAYWDFWDHFVPLTDRSLSELLLLKGFRVEYSLPKFLPYSMSAGWTPPLWLLRLYLHCSCLWPLFGRQFLVIGRKRRGEVLAPTLAEVLPRPVLLPGEDVPAVGI